MKNLFNLIHEKWDVTPTMLNLNGAKEDNNGRSTKVFIEPPSSWTRLCHDESFSQGNLGSTSTSLLENLGQVCLSKSNTSFDILKRN